ncbi:RDD family protein [uncultured Pseudokineococcus sp.]|uniref:RDD family protein n=1 Tax=uncultured Pseudokineococcus sp. TaxID=1642928 RepID=UPI002609FD77|nr:RDD family protein [uncultured Pseudokineococcus sp.]
MTGPGGVEQAWPGRRLGLPRSGARSVATTGRRLLGVLVDWLLALLVSTALLDGDPWATLGVFAVLHAVGVGTVGGSPGHLLLRMRVLGVAGAWPGPLRALVRTVLLCLVIPAAIWDADQRGLHDRFAGTVLLRR